MSGIFGIITVDDSKIIDSSLKKLNKWNSVFGEVQKQEQISAYAGIGICQDHITNAPVCRTPVLNNNGYYAAIDACIYNRDELFKVFGLPLTLSDEEMIFSIITGHGMDKLSLINGDFSGALYNSSAGTITLFTDHMSVRPLFYYKSDSVMAFSTDVRGLISLPEVPGDINPDYLFASLSGYSNSHPTGTEFADVYSIAPGSYLSITRKNETLSYEEHKYWTLGQEKIRLFSEKQYVEKMRELITESIKKRLAVFPDIVGAELSGGLDSGVIDILINRLGQEAVYFSWSSDPKDVPLVENDERLVIEEICKQENISCTFKSSDFRASNANIINNHLKLGLNPDGPGDLNFKLAFPLYTNTEIISEVSQFVSSKGARVVFSGHGGDEGVSHRCDTYELYQYGEKLHFFKCLWDKKHDSKNRLLDTIKEYRYKKSRGSSYNNDPMFSKKDSSPDILSSAFRDSYKDFRGIPNYFPFDPIKYIATGATGIRLKVSALLGPYSGARYIFPYLDKDVINYAVSIPRYLYIKGDTKRYIFRQAFKDIMPKALSDVTYKNTPSSDTEQKENSDWFIEAQKHIRELYDLLDKDYWSKYLDFEVISRYKDSDRPVKEDELKYMAVFTNLMELYYFQHMVDTIKKLDQ